MRKILHYLVLVFTLIFSVVLNAQEPWKERNVSVVGTFENFRVNQAKKNNDYEIFVGVHLTSNSSVAVINGVYVDDILNNDLPSQVQLISMIILISIEKLSSEIYKPILYCTTFTFENLIPGLRS